MDLAPLEEGCRRSEDKVGGALYVASVEVQAGILATGEEGILIAEQTAVLKTQTVSLGVERDGLSELRGIVLYSEIAACDIRAVNLDCISAECAHIVDIGMMVVGDHHPVGPLTLENHILQP